MEFLAALLFVLSSGTLFAERYRESRVLVIGAAALAIVSTIFLTTQMLDLAKPFREQEDQRTQAVQQAKPTSGPLTPPDVIVAMPMSSPGLGERITQASYQITKHTLDWIVRTGTGDPKASVSSDTVVGTIIALLLAVLALIGSALSALVRRLWRWIRRLSSG